MGEGGTRVSGRVGACGASLDSRQQPRSLLRRQRLTAEDARPPPPQLDDLAAQCNTGRHPCRLASLRLTANLDDHALAFVEPPAAWQDFAQWQEGRPIAADVDKRCAERQHQPAHPAEMDAAGLAPIAALDEEFDGNAFL